MLIGMQEIIAIWVYLYLHFLEANQRIIFFGKAEALPKMSFQRNCQKPKADTLKYLKISQHAHYPSI